MGAGRGIFGHGVVGWSWKIGGCKLGVNGYSSRSAVIYIDINPSFRLRSSDNEYL